MEEGNKDPPEAHEPRVDSGAAAGLLIRAHGRTGMVDGAPHVPELALQVLVRYLDFVKMAEEIATKILTRPMDVGINEYAPSLYCWHCGGILKLTLAFTW